MATDQLSSAGFTPRTASEIKSDFVDNLTLSDSSFTEQDADIQDCLLDTAIVPLMQFEKLVQIMLNGYSSDYATDAIFLRFAESVGLRQKAAFNAQVMLRFTGKVGDMIPKNTECTDSEGNVVYKTLEVATIGTLGYVDVYAYSESTEVAKAGEINTIKSILQDGISVNNLNDGLAYQDEETIDELRTRVQARFRSTRLGGKYYAESLLKSIEGVNQRLIAFYTTTIEETDENGINYRVPGVEAVIGGGDDYEVATALFRSFLETQKLVSAPSDDDTSRTISLDLYAYNNSVNVKFTRPKLIELKLQMYITFTSSISTPTSIEAMCSDEISEYVNNLTIGTSVTGWSLNNIVVPIMKTNGIDPSIIATLRWAYATSDETAFSDFDSDNKIPIILKDCYCTLVEFGVSINV